MMMSPLLDPMHVFAVRGLASLGQPDDDQASMKKFRTALRTTLSAAGLDMSRVTDKPKASFTETKHHALVTWYDVPCNAIRLFAPPLDRIDDITADALELLNGSVIMDVHTPPIEDVDAAARVLALIGAGADDARDLHARFVAPNLHRYDEDFTPPTASDLEELWERLFPYYFGGTSARVSPLDVWVARAYAFGVGHVARPVAPSKAASTKQRRRA